MNKHTNYRWIIVSLLLFSTTINYMDRNVISYLKDYFCDTRGFGWSSTDYSILTTLFTLFYATFTLFVGFIIDKIGTKKGLTFSLTTWSIAGILSAFVGKTVVGQSLVRVIFGAGESGNFPASVKTVAEWFPKKERALATGIFNAGSNIGAMISALLVPLILAAWNPLEGNGLFMGVFHGWQMAFIITGLIGFIWLFFWKKYYGTPQSMLEKGKIDKSEFDYINSDEVVKEKVVNDDAAPKVKVPWYKMLTYRQTWSFLAGKFMTDGVWFFLLFWLPTYIRQQFCVGLDAETTKHIVMYSTFIVFGFAVVGSVFGGSIPMMFMNRGWQTYKARMTALFLIALFPLLLFFTQMAAVHGIAIAIAIISIGGAAHQAWSANLYTTVSDMFPKKAVAAITGIGTTAGAIGGAIIQMLTGRLEDTYRMKGVGEAVKAGLIKVSNAVPLENIKLDNIKDVLADPNSATMLEQAKHLITSNISMAYGILFSICALAYLIAWVVMKILVPKYKPVEL